MTEDEAKTKWCPYALNRVVPFCTIDGKQQSAMYVSCDGRPTTTCMGSQCMKWEWIKEPWKKGDAFIGTEPKSIQAISDALDGNRPEPFAVGSVYTMGFRTEDFCGEGRCSA